MFWLIPLALKAAAVIFASGITLAAIDDLILSIDAKISRPTIKEVMKYEGLNDVVVRAADRTNNVVKLQNLNNDDIWEIRGTGVDYDIQKGVRITI